MIVGDMSEAKMRDRSVCNERNEPNGQERPPVQIQLNGVDTSSLGER